MARPNQQHHTVPMMYLRGFAGHDSRGRDWIELLDLRTGGWRRQRPSVACQQRGFYAVDVPGWDTNAVETEILAKFEGEAAPLIRRLPREAIACARRGAQAPRLTRSEREILVAFVALMYVRNRPIRERARRLAGRLGEGLLRRDTENRERFEAQVARARAAGVEIDLTFDDLVDVVESGDVVMDFENTFHVGRMLATWEKLRGRLAEKRLSFLVAGRSSGLLVSSDSPVSVTVPSETGKLEVGLFVADPLHEDTTVSMPLTSEVLVRLDANLPDETRHLGKEEVAMLNTATVTPNRELVIARTRFFRWLDDHGRLREPAELRDALADPISRIARRSESDTDLERVDDLLRKLDQTERGRP